MFSSLVLMLLFCTMIGSEAARILAYYPCPAFSHQLVFRTITQELLKQGHQVTVITTDPIFTKDNRPVNLTEIDIHDVSYKMYNEYFIESINGDKGDMIQQAKIMTSLFVHLIEEHFKVKDLQDLLQYKKGHFDLILLEALFPLGLGLSHKFSAPVVLISSFGPFPGNYEAVGAPTHLTIYHDFTRQKLYDLTLWDKLKELINRIRIKLVISENEEKGSKVLKRIFGADIPPIDILKNNVHMLFVNLNPIWEGNYPVPPNVIHMGGLHQKPSKELPKDLKDYLDSSKNGMIYFSFGTNINPSLLPPEKISIFVKVFSQLPYNVIWKWHNENFPVKSTNIKIYKWVPQSDILRHPNVKLFINQGGLQSTDEAITAGVPLIGIPMLGDQWYNVEKYVHHQIGVRLDLEDLTEHQLKSAIIQVAENETYRNNVLRLRSQMEDQPQHPLERTIWWIEYVLRHKGAKHLRAPTANMPWSEFLELKLVSITSLAVIVSLVITVIAARAIINYLLRNYLLYRKLKKS